MCIYEYVCVYVTAAVESLSRVRLFATPWPVAHQAPLSMGFSRQECWGGLPCLPSGGLPDPGIKPGSPALQADSLPLSHQGSPCMCIYMNKYIYMRIYVICTHTYIYIWVEIQERHLAKFPGNRIWINKQTKISWCFYIQNIGWKSNDAVYGQ